MHRDIARLLVLLAVVRVLAVTACPAPAPSPASLPRLPRREADTQLKHYVTRRKPALPQSNRDGESSANRECNFVPDPWGPAQPVPGPTPGNAPDQRPTAVARVPEPQNKQPRTGGSPEPPRPPAAPATVLVPSGRPAVAAPGPSRPARGGGRRPQRRGARGRRGRGGGRTATAPTAHRPGTGLSIGALNVQSLKPKLLELSDELSRQDLDIMLLSETWLRPSTPKRLLVFFFYKFSLNLLNGRIHRDRAPAKRSLLR